MSNSDLPAGYRWATEEEYYVLEGMQVFPDYVKVVPRTVDSTGKPYTHGEADLAVPINKEV